MYKNVLVPTDGSKLSDNAVEQAVQFAKESGARITVLHVMPPLEEQPLPEVEGRYDESVDEGYILPPSLKEHVQESIAARSKAILDGVCAKAEAAGVRCESVVAASHHPHDAIIQQAAKSNCDLIMMASHGRKGLRAIVLGSETHKVLVHSKVPVLVVR